MAPSKTAKPAKVDEPTGAVFVYEFVAQAPPPGYELPDPSVAGDVAARDTAHRMGMEPFGESKLSGPEIHPDGASLVYRWSVPVRKPRS